MKIFQIYYDDKTEKELDNSFIPFDNSNSNESDWFEYSAIREIFRTNEFDQDELVGIFSPKFFQKTGLRGTDVIKVAENSNADVISFSPHFPQIALFINPFIQGDYHHNGLLDTTEKVFDTIGLKIDLKALVTDQTRTVYSNYFTAKYSFWVEYLIYSEEIFQLAASSSEIAIELNSTVLYKGKRKVALKVFIIERLISAMLQHLDLNAEAGSSYEKTLSFQSNKNIYRELLILDSLKTSFLKTKKAVYINLYYKIIKQLLSANKINLNTW